MAEANYGWFGTRTGDSDVKRRLALHLLMQGTDTSPVQHWTQGAARLAQALAGGAIYDQSRAENQAAMSGLVDALMPSNKASATPTVSTHSMPTQPEVQTAGISDSDMAIKDVADSLRVSPDAVRQVVKVESNFNPMAASPSGTYRGATQIGPETFKEAGGRLGGLTRDEYVNAPLSKQIMAYPDYLQHYGVLDKLKKSGIDITNLPADQQFAYLQGAQFAPNQEGWMRNPNVPSTTTPQAGALGNTSVAAMAASPYGRAALGGGVGTASAAPAAPSPVQAAMLSPKPIDEQRVGMVPPRAPQPSPPPQQVAQAPQQFAAPQRAEPAIPDNVREAVRRALQSGDPTAQQMAVQILQKYTAPTQYGFQTLPDGTIVRTNPATGAVEPVYQGPTKPQAMKLEMGDQVVFVDPTKGTVTGPGGQPVGGGPQQPLTDLSGNKVAIPTGQNPKEFIKHFTGAQADAAAGKLTEEQARSTQFANRMEQAEVAARKFQDAAQDLTATVGNYYSPGLNNAFVASPQFQQYQQAKSNFVTALLRRESGAAINRDEFIRYDREFFPQYGDSQEVIAQKQRARETAIEAMKKTAGPGYKSPPGSGDGWNDLGNGVRIREKK